VRTGHPELTPVGPRFQAQDFVLPAQRLPHRSGASRLPLPGLPGTSGAIFVGSPPFGQIWPIQDFCARRSIVDCLMTIGLQPMSSPCRCYHPDQCGTMKASDGGGVPGYLPQLRLAWPCVHVAPHQQIMVLPLARLLHHRALRPRRLRPYPLVISLRPGASSRSASRSLK